MMVARKTIRSLNRSGTCELPPAAHDCRTWVADRRTPRRLRTRVAALVVYPTDEPISRQRVLQGCKDACAVANRRSEPGDQIQSTPNRIDCDAHSWAFCGPRHLSRKIGRLEGAAKNLTPDDPRHALLAQIKYYRDLIERPTSAGRRQPSPRGRARG
jgi:hypothetical protein